MNLPVQSRGCVLCDSRVESSTHLFLHCPFASKLFVVYGVAGTSKVRCCLPFLLFRSFALPLAALAHAWVFAGSVSRLLGWLDFLVHLCAVFLGCLTDFMWWWAVQSKGSSTATKTFAQALSNSCNIPTSKLSKPCLKGEQISIKITETEYLAGVDDCQNVLHGRFTLPKGSSPVRMQDLKEKILKFWKTNEQWSMVFLGCPLALDEATKKRTFGHFARILIDVDLSSNLHERILVERNDFDFYADVEYENIPPFCNSCQIIGHSVNNCKFQTPRATTSSTTMNKPKVKPNTSNVEKPIEGSTANIAADCSKIVVEIDPLVEYIIRSKETETYLSVGDVLNHEKEIPLFSIEAVPVCVQDTSSSSGMTSPIVGDVMNLANEVFCEESHEEEEVVADSIPLDNHDTSIVVPYANLSNFNANVIHDMQVLGLLSAPTAAQQTMDFLKNSWANMTQTEEMIASVGNTNQQFQLVVPKKGKNKFKQKQAEASKGFKVGGSNR
ncbi:hypothetical protein TSUD_282220 [Trifolium subterraneum]|uniref:Uncharacterized protein n=1 Tax=Trifolium subterraneum TaxID=3900 RepID=A0A2Z6MI71_TRISU|nr:hypothetical protein TSUD_282220 [Trifolium subterraneum]